MEPQQKPAKKPNYRERVRLGLVKAKARSRIKPVAEKKKASLAMYREWSQNILETQKTCQRCESASLGLEPHHPSGRSRWHLFEIVCLCHHCHTWVHEYPSMALNLGWLTPAYRGLKPDPNFKPAVQPFTYFPPGKRYTAKVGHDLEQNFDSILSAKQFIMDNIERADVGDMEIWSIADNALIDKIILKSGDLKP